MKKMIVVLLATLATAAYAAENKEANFMEAKQRILQMQNERMTAMQAVNACVQAAQTREDLITCRRQAEQARHDFKERHHRDGFAGQRSGGVQPSPLLGERPHMPQ